MASTLHYANAMGRVVDSIALMVAAVILFTTCRKEDSFLDNLTHFNFETDYTVKVPASPVTPFPVPILTQDIATHSEEVFTANRTRADLVERINLSKLELSVKTPTDGNLKFLKSVDIYAVADGLPDVRIAYKDLVPDDVQGTLSLDVTGVELKEYFKKEKYKLRITVVTDEAVTQDYGVNAHGVFFVDAKILGE